MTDFIAGSTVTLPVEWDQYPGGPATDVTDPTITIKTIGGTVVVDTTPTGVVHVATGRYSYDWAIPANQEPGSYVVIWDATNADSEPIQASEVDTVTAPPATGTWCTVADVPRICQGATVSAADVTAAQAVIESVIHRVWRVTDADRRDYVWLQRAVAWQSVYVNQHPEVLTMMPIQSWSQDGMSFTLAAGSGSGLSAYVSPVAMRMLDNLFRGSNGTIRFNSAFQKNRARGSGYNGSVPWTAA
jgi:hypothetical protein